jgi:hypothetical protein
MSDVRTVYAKARAETAKLLGYGDDLDGLSAEQSTRLDLAVALRIALDDQAAKVLRGESADVSKLLSASEALSKLLPPAVLAAPPPANCPYPRAAMWATYKSMRDRGAAFGEGYDGKVRRIAELEAEIERLKAGDFPVSGKSDAPGASTGQNAPVGDNVVPLREPSKPAPAAPVQRGLLTDAVDEPWRPFVGGGSRRDPWADNRT